MRSHATGSSSFFSLYNQFSTNFSQASRPSRTAYLGELEKHLADYRSGNAELYSSVPQEMFRQTVTSSRFLARFDPKASQMVSGYLTGLTYSQRARFINGIDEATEAISQIQRAGKNSAGIPVSLPTIDACCDRAEFEFQGLVETFP